MSISQKPRDTAKSICPEYVNIVCLGGKQGVATREEVDREVLMAKGGRVIVRNPAGEILIQRRSPEKPVFPHYWDIGAAETVRQNENYWHAALRALNEELGLQNVQRRELSHLGWLEFNHDELRRRLSVYEFTCDDRRHGLMQPQASEVSALKFVNLPELEKIVNEGVFSPIGAYVCRKYVLPKIYIRHKHFVPS